MIFSDKIYYFMIIITFYFPLQLSFIFYICYVSITCKGPIYLKILF